MSDTLLFTLPGTVDEDGADFALKVWEDAEGTPAFERGPGTRRGACGEEAELIREILNLRARPAEPPWAFYRNPAHHDWKEAYRVETEAALRAARVEGVAAERERVRLELLAEADRLYRVDP